MKKLLFAIVSVFLFCSADMAAEESGQPVLFLFQRNSDILMATYRSNPAGLEYLRQSVNANRSALRNSKGHFRIVSFILSKDSTDFAAINNASIQGSVVRSWLIKQHRVNSRNSTFYIDRSSGFDNRVEVVYLDFSVPANASQKIHYTLERGNRAMINAAIGRYNPIPFLDIKLAVSEIPQNIQITPPEELDSVILSPSEIIIEEERNAADYGDKTQPAGIPTYQQPPYTTTYYGNGLSSRYQAGGRNHFPLVGVKTNLLLFAGVYPDFRYYDFTPNIALEVYFARCWSVNADYAYSGRTLGNDDTQKRFGYTSVGLEPRFWFSADNRFKGFYGGIYAAYVQFNVMRPNIREGLGYSGDQFSTGLSVGFVQPLSRRLLMEVGLRGGFRHSVFDRYFHQNGNFVFKNSGFDNSVALQTVNVSLVYRFGKIEARK